MLKLEFQVEDGWPLWGIRKKSLEDFRRYTGALKSPNYTWQVPGQPEIHRETLSEEIAPGVSVPGFGLQLFAYSI